MGSNWRMRCPPLCSHRATGAMSVISPIPQPREDAREKSGIRRPERRDGAGARVMSGSYRLQGKYRMPSCRHACRGRDGHDAAQRIGKDGGRRQEAHNDERLMGEVEEVPRVHENPLAFEEAKDE